MKNTICFIETETQKIPIVFNLNVMEEIQEQYGSMDKWGEAVGGEGEPNIKNLKAGLLAMVNEGIDICNEQNGENVPLLTGKQIGRIISDVGLDKIVEVIKEITVKSTKTGEDPKNA